MEREVGGGIGMGNTCKPLAVSFQCMTKSTTNKKKKKKKKSLMNFDYPLYGRILKAVLKSVSRSQLLSRRLHSGAVLSSGNT